MRFTLWNRHPHTNRTYLSSLGEMRRDQLPEFDDQGVSAEPPAEPVERYRQTLQMTPRSSRPIRPFQTPHAHPHPHL